MSLTLHCICIRDKRLADQSQCENCLLAFWPLFHWLLVICGDPCNLLRSMFLDIFSFWGWFFSNQLYFLSQNNTLLSSLIINSLSSRQIIKLLKCHLTHFWILNLPFKTKFNLKHVYHDFPFPQMACKSFSVINHCPSPPPQEKKKKKKRSI